MPFLFHVEFLAPLSFDVMKYPGAQVVLEFIAPDSFQRRVSGLISLIEETDTRNEKSRLMGIHVQVIPRLTLLKESFDQRILLGRTAEDITREILEEHGYRPHQLKFHLSHTPPIHPYTLQVEQSDFDFVHRVLAKDGIFYYFDCETHEDITFETIHFLDAMIFCSYVKRGMIRYFPPSGMGQRLQTQGSNNQEYTSLYKLQDHHTLVTGQWAYHDTNDQTPEVDLFHTHRSGTDSHLKSPGKNIKFGDGALSLDEIDRQARFAAERAKAKAHHLTASGNIADMASGRLVSLDAGKYEHALTGDYFITAVTHTLNQRHSTSTLDFASVEPDPFAYVQQHTVGQVTHLRALNVEPPDLDKTNDSGPDYRCDISLIKRDIHYRPDLPERPEIPLTFTARIESDGQYASLDNQGRYHLRKLLDLGDRQHTQAINPPLRRLQPYGGPMRQFKEEAQGNTAQSLPTGIHFPLQDGDEVLLSCLNGDPDRPMIIGAHYDANRSGPVNNQNPSENMIRTPADNELLMDDKIGHQIIKLRTYKGHNILQFDAKKAEHMLRLASEHGAMHQYAKQTYHEKSGDTHEERSGNDRIQVVENKSLTKTNKGEIHHQTPTDLLQNAGTNIKHTAQENIEITAYENQVIVVEDENMEITVEGPGGFRIHIKNDNLTIQSAKDTRIVGNGGGDITFHQAGGGFCVTADGNVKLFGNDIQIEGSKRVSLNGNVSYTLSAGSGPAPVVDPALQIQVFALVKAAIMAKPFSKICT